MPRSLTRRELLTRSANGFGAAALAALLAEEARGDEPRGSSGPLPFAPKKPHFAPKATSVISVHGAARPRSIPSTREPLLAKYHGKPFREGGARRLRGEVRLLRRERGEAGRAAGFIPAASSARRAASAAAPNPLAERVSSSRRVSERGISGFLTKPKPRDGCPWAFARKWVTSEVIPGGFPSSG